MSGQENYSILNEKELLLRIATGDEMAFREIFHRFTPRLHPFIFNMVKTKAIAEEMVQEVFTRLWLHRADVAKKENAASWLFTVAANLSLNYLKRIKTEDRFIAHARYIASLEVSVEDQLLEKESEWIMHQAIEQLPTQRKLIYRMSRLQGLSHQEISDQLQISPHTVNNQLTAALKQVRSYLQKAGILVSVIAIIIRE